jgi:hypothetical protein
MKLSAVPYKIPVVWAQNAGVGYITNPIPQTSQIGVVAGRASWPDGFVPASFVPTGSGGTPPWGQDFNGVLNIVTAWSRWYNAGGTVLYDLSFSNTIGGYPRGAILGSAVAGQLWLNTIDDNTTNPDAVGAVGWIAIITQAAVKPSAVIDFYVNGAIGNDANDGLANTVGHAFATLQGAVNSITSKYIALYQAVLHVSDGTYAGVSIGPSAVANWSLVGNTAIPSSCLISATNTSNNKGRAVYVSGGSASVALDGFIYQSYFENVVSNGALVTFSGSCGFNAPTSAFIGLGAYYGGRIVLCGSHTYTGAFSSFIFASNSALILVGDSDGITNRPLTLTASGTPSFSGAFAGCTAGGSLRFYPGLVTFAGSATGPRYAATLNGTIDTNGAGASFLPGTLGGGTSTGGQYY